jgi:two-component system, OmpR family, sensor kinase
MRLPIRTRLTLVFAVTALVVLAISAVALLLGFRRELTASVDEALLERASALAADPRDGVEAMTGTDDVFAQLLDQRGTSIIAATPGFDEDPLPAPASVSSCEPGFLHTDVTIEGESVPARIYATCVSESLTLVVGHDVEDQRDAVARLTAIVALGGPVLLAAMAILGWALAGAALRPVERLRAEASAISSSEPERRLPVPDTGDELQRLVETLNGMLGRMHDALDRERRFVDEASHELRTPLGILQAEVELARKQARSPEELADALASIEQETDRLRRLTQDLLVLARSDRGRLPVHREDVDVSAVIDRVVTEFDEQAGRAGVRVRGGTGNIHARVDADRLRQAIENLVDNAIRHAGTGGTVEVAVERSDGRLRISVTDSGSGFSDAILDRAFEPFARVDGDHAGEGAGLGLTIVRAVAEAHGGSATARNLGDGGAEVSIDVPV